jgi:repressor LexA
VAVPIAGRVAIGQPIFTKENIVGEVLVEGGLARSGPCFAIAVTGDSMVDAGIRECDLVVVREQAVAENGDIVVALLEIEATVKRLVIRDEKIELRPKNQKHLPIPVGPDDGLRILGKVVTVRRPGSNTQTPRTAWQKN